MPTSAQSTRSARHKGCAGAVAISLLALVIVLANPFASRASATTIPMVFPLEKRVKVLQDYLAQRTGHLHQGSDLMAAKMTKELACVGGTVTLRTGTYGGVPEYSLWLAGDDGHGYFYIHINNDTPGTDDGAGGLANAFAPGLVSGAHVQQGQWIANVGDSGNAESTSPHLHFEIHETTSMSSPSMNPYDSLTNAPLYDGTPPPGTGTPSPGAGITRYEQSNSKIVYLGKWTGFSASGASGGTYTYADSPAKALIWFSGTKLDLIATTGTTQGKATVKVDGADKGTIDFSSSTTLRKRMVWSTGTVDSGTHKVEISWAGQAGGSGGTRVNLDALDVTGTLLQAALTKVEQDDARLIYAGAWTPSSTTAASGGSFRYANTSGSSVTIKFTGTYFAWLAKKSSVYGKATVRLDGGTPVTVDLYNATTVFKKAWDTGVIGGGSHTVVIKWTGLKNAAATKTNISMDAVQVLGTID
jgi:murein DD-endopeptidase MepM/ murein hydrolase activator NlpD